MDFRQKKYFFGIALLNILILGIGILFILHKHQNDITLYNIPLYDSRGIFHGGEANIFKAEYPASQYRFIGSTDTLESGIYTITIYYSANQDCYSVSCTSGIDGNPYPAIYSDSYTLSYLYHKFSFRIWVNSRIDYLDICISCGTDSENFRSDSTFYIEKIEISRDYKTTVLYKFLKLLTILVVLDGMVLLLWNHKKLQKNIYIVIGAVCIFTVSSLSLLADFQVWGHDLEFHFARIIGLSDGLLHGNFPVKIQPGWFHDYGYAASVCYGDILLYFPAILYACGVPLIYCYKIYILFINLGTLLIAYFCFQKISRHKYISLACTAIYCLSVSRILNIYLRVAVGEYSAFMFLPLVMLGIRGIYLENTDKSPKNGWIFLCLGMTGIIQTHILSFEMVCLFIALTVLILIKKMSKNIFLSFLKSILVTLCLNIWFLLPLLDYSTDNLKVFAPGTTHGIQHFGLSIYELLSFNVTAVGGASDSQHGLVGRIPECLGLAMLIVILLAFIVLSKCSKWNSVEKHQLLLVMGLSGIALWLATCYFPYNRLADIPVIQNMIASIQFPWRFISIAIPLLTYAACIVFTKLNDMSDHLPFVLILIGICMISAFQCMYCMDSINRSLANYPALYDNRSALSTSRIASGGEYLLTSTDTNLTLTDLDISVKNMQAEILERKGTCMEVSCQTNENAWIEFPIFAYKYYQCIDASTTQSYPITRGLNNKIHVELPDNYQGILKVYFSEPWHWRLAELISLVTLLSITAYTWRKYRHV